MHPAKHIYAHRASCQAHICTSCILPSTYGHIMHPAMHLYAHPASCHACICASCILPCTSCSTGTASLTGTYDASNIALSAANALHDEAQQVKHGSDMRPLLNTCKVGSKSCCSSHASMQGSVHASGQLPLKKRHWMRSGLLSRSMALLSTLMAAQWSPRPCFICASTLMAWMPGLLGSSSDRAFLKAASASATWPSCTHREGRFRRACSALSCDSTP